jgi:hypothetical protein
MVARVTKNVVFMIVLLFIHGTASCWHRRVVRVSRVYQKALTQELE